MIYMIDYVLQENGMWLIEVEMINIYGTVEEITWLIATGKISIINKLTIIKIIGSNKSRKGF